MGVGQLCTVMHWLHGSHFVVETSPVIQESVRCLHRRMLDCRLVRQYRRDLSSASKKAEARIAGGKELPLRLDIGWLLLSESAFSHYLSPSKVSMITNFPSTGSPRTTCRVCDH